MSTRRAAIVDTCNDTAPAWPAAGWFSRWSTADARFVLYNYLIGGFTLYDAPSATSLRLSVSSAFVDELDERVGAVSDGGQVIGESARVPEDNEPA